MNLLLSILSVLMLAHKPVVVVSHRFITTDAGGLLVSIDGSKSYDPDGTITKYQWSWISGPSEVFLTNSQAAITTAAPVNWVAGIYTMRLTVTDNKGATASATMTITVKVAAPVKCSFWNKLFRQNGCHF
jgi:hypothetical protein